MGTTTISLRDEAYKQLEAAKREDESFSDVVLRLTGEGRTRDDLEELAGEFPADFAEAVEESSEEVADGLDPDPAT